jgi:hypothetical protein
MADKIILIVFSLGIVIYSAFLFYLNSKVTLNKDGSYKDTDENHSDAYDVMKTSVSTTGLGAIIFVVIIMLLFFGFVLFDPGFLPK